MRLRLQDVPPGVVIYLQLEDDDGNVIDSVDRVDVEFNTKSPDGGYNAKIYRNGKKTPEKVTLTIQLF